MRFSLSIVLLLAVTPVTRNHPIGLPGQDHQGGPNNHDDDRSHSIRIPEASAAPPHNVFTNFHNLDHSKGITGMEVEAAIDQIPESSNYRQEFDISHIETHTVDREASNNNKQVLERIGEVCKDGCFKTPELSCRSKRRIKQSICGIIVIGVITAVVVGCYFLGKEGSVSAEHHNTIACAKGGGGGGGGRGSGRGKGRC